MSFPAVIGGYVFIDVILYACLVTQVQGLEDTIQRQKADVENFSSQARSALSKYQTLLRYSMHVQNMSNATRQSMILSRLACI